MERREEHEKQLTKKKSSKNIYFYVENETDFLISSNTV